MPFKFSPIMSQNLLPLKLSYILGKLLLGWNSYQYSLDK
jgi:hypothetical protein